MKIAQFKITRIINKCLFPLPILNDICKRTTLLIAQTHHNIYTEEFWYIMKYLITPTLHDCRMSRTTSAILTYVFQCSLC